MKQIGVIIGWLSGSLAGITAGLYALGFVATIGADTLLGIDSALSAREPAFYIGRGANLVMRTLIIGMLSALPIILLGGAVRWLNGRPVLDRLDPSGRGRRVIGASMAPLSGLAMFMLAMVGLRVFVLPARAAHDLLFTSEISAEICQARNPLTLAIFAQDRHALGDWFTWMALLAGAVAGLALLSHERLASAGQGIWLVIAATAGFLVLVEVPLAYGFMAVEITPHRVEIATPPGSGAGPLRLLARSNGGLLLWRESERGALWIKDSEVKSFTIGAGAPIAPLGCGDPRPF